MGESYIFIVNLKNSLIIIQIANNMKYTEKFVSMQYFFKILDVF